jgi:Tfp pilus assembly protein FimT
MVRIHGASLLELLVCLVLLATIARTGALRLPEILAGVRLSGTTHRLSAALRQARGRALERGGPVEIVLDEVAGVWEMRDSNGSSLEREMLPRGISFTGWPASRRVRFSAIGTADNATIVLGAGSVTRRVVVNQRGRVRVQ